MADNEELQQLIAEALDAHGLKAAGFVIFDISPTRLCLTGESYPHIIVCADNQRELDTVALQMNVTFGVMVIKQFYQEFLMPLPIGGWRDRGR